MLLTMFDVAADDDDVADAVDDDKNNLRHQKLKKNFFNANF